MMAFTASWKLHTALKDMNTPREIIDVTSPLFQHVIEEIQEENLTPKEGARIVLGTLYKAKYDRGSS